MRNLLLTILSITLPFWITGCKPDADLDDEIERNRIHDPVPANKEQFDAVKIDQDDARND